VPPRNLAQNRSLSFLKECGTAAASLGSEENDKHRRVAANARRVREGQGDSDLRNAFGWSLGAAYAIVPALSIFAFLDGATSVAPGQDDPLELRVGTEFKLVKGLKLTVTGTRGLSNGSPDWGLSAGLTARF
jgi:hypothetical protein